DGGQYYFAAQIYAPGSQSAPYHLPKPRAACAKDPNDACCRSCGQAAGEGCDSGKDDCSGSLAPEDDQINLRCFDQKRRFGINFLNPIDRYVTGLTSQVVPDSKGQTVPNPVFQDLNPSDEISNVRDPGLVFVAGIVGVPWQDIARKNSKGEPDLIEGLNKEGQPVGGFQNAEELSDSGTWDIILGDPASYKQPTDPLMQESIEPRQGTNPVTGDAVAPPGSPPDANPINGHEYSIPDRNDLQYACVFNLKQSRDCTDPSQTACDCASPENDNPLCKPQPDQQVQYRAKAYPGLRELSLLKSVGEQGIVASICPKQMETPGMDYGYRAAVRAVIDRLKLALGGQCLGRSLTPNADGQVPCLILEARKTGGKCECSGKARQPVQAAHQQAVVAAMLSPVAQGQDCFCELVQLAGTELHACQMCPSEPVMDGNMCQGGRQIHGWCYIDQTAMPPVGNAEIVKSCPETERRMIRFVGEGKGATGATLFIACVERE
ncbi:MAG: hypothetical protein HY744_03140, partial [Deltaproteobacteria bacterium]|nr:hypothetical protein [Deltaproteobacteria bacterium]